MNRLRLELKENIINKILLCSLFIINFFWYIKLGGYHTIMGDDLNSWDFFRGKSFLEAVLLNDFADKYRPVFNLVQYILYKLFDNNYQLYFMFNITFNCIIIYFVYKLLNLISNNKYISYAISLLFITSRFAYYNILQIYGLMEAICTLFLILIILNSYLLYCKGKKSGFLYILILEFLIIFTHERFIAIIPVIILFMHFHLIHEKKKKKKIIAFGLIVSPIIFYLMFKKLFLKSSILVGTGYTSIKINVYSVIKFFIGGLLNLFGFNIGPEHLNGIPINQVNLTTIIVSVLVLILSMIVFIAAIKGKDKKEKLIEFKIFLIMLMLVCALVLVSSITVYQELRWLQTPYLVFIIYMGYLFAKINSKKLMMILMILFTCCNLKQNSYYKDYIHNIYFVYSQQISDSAYDETIKKYGTNIRQYKVFIEKHRDIDWPLLDSLFLKPYLGDDTFKVEYVDNILDVDLTKIDPTKVVLLKLNDSQKRFINVTNEVILYKNKALGKNKNIKYSLIDHFHEGEVTPQSVNEDTPNGEGVFIFDWTTQFQKINTLTIISGFKYTYKNIFIPTDSKICGDLILPLKGSDGANFYISINDNGNERRIYESNVTQESNFNEIEISIEGYSGKNVDITFGVESPNGNNIADWIALGDLGIAQR
ncbi:glycosyltransferase family 39 protein [Paenibacillus guangzhouensis]|uniref:glycosyltransferase family 39 protein n=1 Tax=Paenibacillus guangzhouensis TaxID=1473112 RepID=UPI00187B60D4|nr:glycosyltransferase family 39 protein [Paenibacillus guangzhouensis]